LYLEFIILILIILKTLVDNFKLVVFSIASISYTILNSKIINSRVVVYLVNYKDFIIFRLYYKAYINKTIRASI
jgi:hypothetical protein